MRFSTPLTPSPPQPSSPIYTLLLNLILSAPKHRERGCFTACRSKWLSGLGHKVDLHPFAKKGSRWREVIGQTDDLLSARMRALTDSRRNYCETLKRRTLVLLLRRWGVNAKLLCMCESWRRSQYISLIENKHKLRRNLQNFLPH